MAPPVNNPLQCRPPFPDPQQGCHRCVDAQQQYCKAPYVQIRGEGPGIRPLEGTQDKRHEKQPWLETVGRCLEVCGSLGSKTDKVEMVGEGRTGCQDCKLGEVREVSGRKGRDGEQWGAL